MSWNGKLKGKENEVISLYKSGLSSLKVAKIFDVQKSSVLRFLKKNGISIRPLTEAKRIYSFDDEFFESIDIEDKAYFFGLLAADGTNNGINAVTLALQEGDKHILETFKECIKWDGELKLLNNASDRYKNRQNLYKIGFYGKSFSEKLSKLGIVKNKTEHLVWPECIKEGFVTHFIRGYFDGNGSISKSDFYRPALTIVSTRSFANKLKDIIESELGINVQFFNYKRHNYNTIVLTIAGRNQMLRFLDWIYTDASIFLKRKFNRYYKLKFKKVDNRGRKYFNNELTIKNKNIYDNYIPSDENYQGVTSIN